MGKRRRKEREPRPQRVIDFFGQEIRLVDEVSEWALMEFAHDATTADSNSLEGLAAVMQLLREAVDPVDWDLFKATARANRVNAEQCMTAVVTVFQEQTNRPTGRPSVSSDGPRVTATSSTVGSSPQGIDRLAGRPDLQLVAKQAQAARAS